MRRILYFLPVLCFGVLAVWFGQGLTRDPDALPSAMIGREAPKFDLAGVAGKPGLAGGDLKGQVALVNFFASWCVPCRIEHPILMRLAAEHRVALYGVAYKDRPEDAERLLKQLGNPYSRIGLDSDGRAGIDFGVYGVPETYVIDEQGRIRYRQVGPISADVLEHVLMPMLKDLGVK